MLEDINNHVIWLGSGKSQIPQQIFKIKIFWFNVYAAAVEEESERERKNLVHALNVASRAKRRKFLRVC
jgi:hypothetical protein